MSEAALLMTEGAWEDQSCLNLKRRLVLELGGTETEDSDVRVAAIVNLLQNNQNVVSL